MPTECRYNDKLIEQLYENDSEFDAVILIADIINSVEVGNYFNKDDYMDFLFEYKKIAAHVIGYVIGKMERELCDKLERFCMVKYPHCSTSNLDIRSFCASYLKESFYTRIVGDEIVIVATLPVRDNLSKTVFNIDPDDGNKYILLEDIIDLHDLLLFLVRIARNLKISWYFSKLNFDRLKNRKGIIDIGIGIDVGQVSLNKDVLIEYPKYHLIKKLRTKYQFIDMIERSFREDSTILNYNDMVEHYPKIAKYNKSMEPEDRRILNDYLKYIRILKYPRLGAGKHPEGFALSMAKRVEQASRFGRYTKIMAGETAYYLAKRYSSIHVDWELCENPGIKGISQDLRVFEVRDFTTYLYWDCAEMEHGQERTDSLLLKKISEVSEVRSFPGWLGADIGTMKMYQGRYTESEKIFSSLIHHSSSKNLTINLAEAHINHALDDEEKEGYRFSTPKYQDKQTYNIELAISIFRELSKTADKYIKEQGLLLDANLFYLKRNNLYSKLKTYSKYIQHNLGWRNCKFGDVRVLFWNIYLQILMHEFIIFLVEKGQDVLNESKFNNGDALHQDIYNIIINFIKKDAGDREIHKDYYCIINDLYSHDSLRKRVNRVLYHHGLERIGDNEQFNIGNLQVLDKNIRDYSASFTNDNYKVNIMQGEGIFFGLIIPYIFQDSPNFAHVKQYCHDNAVKYITEANKLALRHAKGEKVYNINIEPWIAKENLADLKIYRAKGLLQLINSDSFVKYNQYLLENLLNCEKSIIHRHWIIDDKHWINNNKDLLTFRNDNKLNKMRNRP